MHCARPLIRPTAAGRAKRGQVVVIHLVAEAGVADLVEPQELIERHVLPSGIRSR